MKAIPQMLVELRLHQKGTTHEKKSVPPTIQRPVAAIAVRQSPTTGISRDGDYHRSVPARPKTTRGDVVFHPAQPDDQHNATGIAPGQQVWQDRMDVQDPGTNCPHGQP